MSFFYKVALEGTHTTQNIVNILYYGDSVGEGFGSYSEDLAQDLADSLAETLVEDYCAALPTEYTLNVIRVTSVDERGVTNSPYDVTVLPAESGIQGGATQGAMLCAILPFTTTVSGSAARNLKRSYLAYGPVPGVFIGENQILDPTYLGLISPMMLALQAPIAGGIEEFAPVRIARTVAPAPVGVGVVRSISMAQCASTRASRKRSPRGT
jgi:hypothetical protein